MAEAKPMDLILGLESNTSCFKDSLMKGEKGDFQFGLRGFMMPFALNSLLGSWGTVGT